VTRAITPNSPASEIVMTNPSGCDGQRAGASCGSAAGALRYVLPVRILAHEPSAFGGTRMSVGAFVLIQTEVGKAAAVAEQIRGLDGVASADDVTGPYDVIVRVEADTVDELGKLVVANVQAVSGITRTLTCPIVHL
jgi:DNA-binding Lrp family transcriptional regulator